MKNTFDLTDYNFKPFTVTIGETYKAIGTCGEAKDIEVIGRLKETNLSTATLTNEKGQPFQVNAKTLQFTPTPIEGSELTFDDVVIDDDGGRWTQLCDKHADQLETEPTNGLISEGGSGICGVVGCDKESNHYLDF